MSIEIEAKMRLTDRAAVERRLGEVGAKAWAPMTEVNTYFDTAQGQLKSTDQGLRIRIEHVEGSAPSVIVTHKGPRAHGHIKSRSEVEVEVQDARSAAELLTALGYVPVLSFEKRRNRWELDGCLVELDTLPYLGEFIEIEGPSEQAVLAVRKNLELDSAPLLRTSYIAMLLSYTREHRLRSTSMTFAGSEAATAVAES